MTRPQGETIRARFFMWRLRQRSGVFFADGRANSPNVGRHSLGTRDREDALAAIHELDAVIAVRHGMIAAEEMQRKDAPLPLEEGRRLYMEYVSRPQVARGVRKRTLVRYRTVLEKFSLHAETQRITTWNQVTAKSLLGYADFLENVKGRATRTVYFELTTLKQVVGWLIKEKLLPAGAKIHLSLRKPQGTDTYCWKRQEFQAMLEHCAAHPDLTWLGEILLALGVTGLRISELLDLRWSNVLLEKRDPVILLVDETASKNRSDDSTRRTLKSGRGRVFPIEDNLLKLLREKGSRTGRVFRCPSQVPRTADAIRKIFIREVINPLIDKFPTEDGEIGFANGRFHSFRHYFCSQCANSGLSVQTVMTWLGHTESTMVMHYFHLHDDEARRQLGRVRFFEKDSNDGTEPPGPSNQNLDAGSTEE